MSNESKALDLAAELENNAQRGALTDSKAAAELRRQHTEIESLRAQLAARVPDGWLDVLEAFEKKERPPFQAYLAAALVGALRNAMLSAAPLQQAPNDAAQSVDETNAVLAARYFDLLKVVEAYEKHGVTCQTFRHFVDAPCAECNCTSQQAPVQGEPVAWKHDCAALLQNDVELWVARCPHCGKPRDTHAQQASEPVAYLYQCRKKPELEELSFSAKRRDLEARGYEEIPLGIIKGGAMSMTDEQIDAVYEALCNTTGFSYMTMARAIESAATAPLLERIAELEKALKLVQQHHATAWNRGHIAGMAANRMVARDAMKAVEQDAWNNTQLTEALIAAEKRSEELERANEAFVQRQEWWNEKMFQLERELATERALSFRDQVAQLERELEALRKDAGWRAIETAPKDGAAVLVSEGRFCYCVEWNQEFDWWAVDDNKLGPFRLRGAAPTHWMPLPPPPDAAKEKP